MGELLLSSFCIVYTQRSYQFLCHSKFEYDFIASAFVYTFEVGSNISSEAN